MTAPKEKAEELIDKFNLFSTGGYQLAKQCALIAVDEILTIPNVIVSYNVYDYWQEVKTEIENYERNKI